jgi:hypothetical protein
VLLQEQNEARLADLLSASTVWIANIEPEFCTEKYIKKRVTEESGSIVLACTLRKISKHDTAVLIEQDTKKHLPPPQWYHKSWAVRYCYITSRAVNRILTRVGPAAGDVCTSALS